MCALPEDMQKRQLKETASPLRAHRMWPQAPEVYTGRVLELHKSFLEWYSKAYSEDNPLVCCPQHVLLTVKKDAGQRGWQVDQNRV